jgi:hypothetical protein
MPVYYKTYDMTWESYPAWIWFAIESHVGIICASAPALKLFFRQTLQVSLGSKSWRRKKNISDYELTYDSGGQSTDAPKSKSTARRETHWITTAASEEHITSITDDDTYTIRDDDTHDLGTRDPGRGKTFFNDADSGSS